MLKIQYASDLHLEFPENTAHMQAHPLEVTGDVLVLAGDIHVLGAGPFELHPFMQWCAQHFQRIFIVPGNHEYYAGHDLATTLHNWKLPVLPNVSFVNNRSVVIGDTELFFTTLWSRIPPQDEMLVNRHLNDCHRMIYREQPFQACHYGEVHQLCLDWLDTALRASAAVHRVVVTHHCPIVLEDPRYESNGLTWAVVVPLERFIESHHIGHTHYNGGRGLTVGDTTLHTNQLGYVKAGIEAGFAHNAVITL